MLSAVFLESNRPSPVSNIVSAATTAQTDDCRCGRQRPVSFRAGATFAGRGKAPYRPVGPWVDRGFLDLRGDVRNRRTGGPEAEAAGVALNK